MAEIEYGEDGLPVDWVGPVEESPPSAWRRAYVRQHEWMRIAKAERGCVRDLEAERDRLREALERVRDNAKSWHGPPQDRGQDRALAVIAQWCDEALGPGSEGK